MVVMTPKEPRETWTDERLDDLNKKVDDGFATVDQRFAEAKAETSERFDRVETRMENGFAEINDRFDRMQRTLFAGLVALCVALIGSCATLVGIAVL